MNHPPQGGLPPWIDPTMQHQIQWRDGDIVIAVPPKSGTTWTMNIVHQLLSGGDATFFDIYAQVPWIEFVTRPGMPVDELLMRLERMPRDRPRAFKTHSLPQDLSYAPPGEGNDVRYVVVMRNPEEALVSMKSFLEQHSDTWLDLWQMPRDALCWPDFSTFYQQTVTTTGMHRGLFAFLNAWWPLRTQANVLCLHFSDMVRDHEGAVRRIANFIGVVPDAAQWPAVLEYTGFPWMKQHATKFDSLSSEVPPLKPGAMVRKGKAGVAQEDGMTAAIAQDLRQIGQQMCTDSDALRWFYQGGALS
jgi:hypothetical protein